MSREHSRVLATNAKNENLNKDALTMVETVKKNMEGYTKREIQRAARARKVYKMMGRPSPNDFVKMVDLFKDCPITRDDIQAANEIFGKDIGALKGKQ